MVLDQTKSLGPAHQCHEFHACMFEAHLDLEPRYY